MSLIRNSGDTKELVFYGEGPRFFGIEVEMEFEEHGERNNWLQKAIDWEINENLSIFTPVYDGSLSSIRGVEIVFQPHSLEELEKMLLRFPFPDPEEIYDTYEDYIGVHVNISRNALNESEWARFSRFIYQCSDLWIKRSNRYSSEWAEYSKSLNASLYNPTLNEGKYHAVRFGSDRVEVRTFRSFPNNLPYILCYVRLCNTLMNFCQLVTNEQFMVLETANALEEAFLKFEVGGILEHEAIKTLV